MFTGIIQSIGRVSESKQHGGGYQIAIEGVPNDWKIPVGGSVACNGVCLTATEIGSDHALFEVGPETVRITGSERWQTGSQINLEPALRVGDPLGGHNVSGHVEGVGIIRSSVADVDGIEAWIDIGQLGAYVVSKGSITIDGISLTINEIKDTSIRVNLIGHTIQETTCEHWTPNVQVNIETDNLVRTIKQAVIAAMQESNHA